MIFTNSLAGRLFTLTAIWAVFSVTLVAWYLTQSYRAGAEASQIERLTANLYNIMGSVEPTESGILAGRPDLRDSRFQQFRSGYYWSVNEVAEPTNMISSASLAGDTISIGSNVAFDESFQRASRLTDQAGNELVAIEAQAFLGEGDDLYSFKITGNRSEVDRQVGAFVQQLLLALGLFAAGFVLAAYFIVRLGLAPLDQVSRQLGEIRVGKSEKILGRFPEEIQPLIDETNSLIDSNRAVVERARTQVGNLAHSLKTPLAVLLNEGTVARPDLREKIRQQVTQMQLQIQTYLDRARISARSGTITSRTEVESAVQRLIRVMRKLNPDIRFELSMPSGGTVLFAGEQQDFEEMIGNLLENAGKFANTQVLVTVDTTQEKCLFISVEDDGQGMTEKQCEEALKRGTRIDETKPGSGLGLSIVKDIASEYGGRIKLTRSRLNGLKASLQLPRAHHNNNRKS